MTEQADFGFAFEKPPGWNKKHFPYTEGNTLAEALVTDPSLVGLELSQVFCLHTLNMVWANQGAYFDGPWVDPEPMPAQPG